MKMMKLLASCAMVGALTAVCASGVFAASSADICSDYVADEGATTGYVTVTPGEYTAAGDYTVLVYPAQVVEGGETVNLDEVAEISDAYIKQIDQNSTGSFTLKFDGLADGEYYVRLGGAESGYVYDTFTVGEVNQPETVIIGDVDDNDSITMNDFTELAKYLALMQSSSVYDSDKNWYAAAYCDGNNSITMNDFTAVAKYLALMTVDNVNKPVEIGLYGDKPVETTN